MKRTIDCPKKKEKYSYFHTYTEKEYRLHYKLQLSE